MGEPLRLDRWSLVSDAAGRLNGARAFDTAVEILRSTARSIAQADGVTVVRREGNMVRYIAEDAISPLWTGQAFPMESCISGIAMIERSAVVIPDIRKDARVPLNAYLSTFVASMAMFPVGVGDPIAAIGAYWKDVRTPDEETIILLTTLARSAGATFEHLAIMGDIGARQGELRQAS